MNTTSVSATLATLSTLVATCGNRLRGIIDVSIFASVPAEILALANEVGDLRIVLAELEANHQVMVGSTIITGQADYTDARILSLLEAAQRKVMGLDKLVTDTTKLGLHNERLFKKAAWLRRKSLGAAMVQELRDIKQNLMLVMASKTT